MADTESVEQALLLSVEALAKKAGQATSSEGAEQFGSAAHHLAEAYSVVSGRAFSLGDLSEDE